MVYFYPMDSNQTFPREPSLAATTAQRLARYVRNDFNPQSDESWQVASLLWRAALLTRNAERIGVQS